MDTFAKVVFGISVIILLYYYLVIHAYIPLSIDHLTITYE